MLRRDLYAHSPVEIDPDNPAHQTHRDAQERAYFEFSTNYLDDVRRVLREYGYEGHTTIEETSGPAGEPCLNCGYVGGAITPTVCPNCHFRDIAACPHCEEEVARQEYEPVAGELFRCPRCRTYVRLQFNDPLIRSDGSYNQPVVVVEEAVGEPA